jgi:hypothetical protein
MKPGAPASPPQKPPAAPGDDLFDAGPAAPAPKPAPKKPMDDVDNLFEESPAPKKPAAPKPPAPKKPSDGDDLFGLEPDPVEAQVAAAPGPAKSDVAPAEPLAHSGPLAPAVKSMVVPPLASEPKSVAAKAEALPVSPANETGPGMAQATAPAIDGASQAIDGASQAIVGASQGDESDESDEPRVDREGMRLWTDNTSMYSVVARLVAVQNGKARLLKDTGRYTTVPLGRLSAPDLEFVERYVRAANEATKVTSTREVGAAAVGAPKF